jgi:hypothetical protein
VNGYRCGLLPGENMAAERDGLAASIVRIVGSGRGECTGERNIAGRAAAARDREYIVRRTGLAFLLSQGERSAESNRLRFGRCGGEIQRRASSGP